MKIKNLLTNLIVFCLVSVFSLIVLVGALEFLLRKRQVSKVQIGRWHTLASDWDKKDVHGQAIKDPSRHLKYYDYFLYSAGPYSSETLNYSKFYSARLCPDSVDMEKAKTIIWTFGGSTMQNNETSDDMTIANQIAVNLNQKGFDVFVHNFGTGSFQSSKEIIKFQEILRNTDKDRRPDIAVFYDGYNDSVHGIMFGAGKTQADLSKKIRMLVENRWDLMARYSAAQYLKDKSLFFERFLYRHIVPKEIYKGMVWDYSDSNTLKSAETYLLNVKMITGMCKELEIKPVFVLQPMVVTKKGTTDFEKKYVVNDDMRKAILLFYSEVKERLKENNDFLDLSSIFDNNGESNFYDLGHTSPYSGLETGKAIAAFLEDKVA